jgi:Zn-dependent protease
VSCRRHNRCVEQYFEGLQSYRPVPPNRGADRPTTLRRLLALLAGAGAFLAKFGAALFKFKFLFSMFVSAAFYGWFGGWWFGIGLIALLFMHEMGHVLEARRQGLPVSVPVFIPFMGALISMKRMPHDAWREARLAIAGPLLGSAAALALYLAGVAYDSQHLKALAFLGFLINLFNLLPVVPLDGGRITAALHPALWLVGLLVLVGLVLYQPNPILILILFFAGSELLRRWRARRLPQMRDYYRVRPLQRLVIAGLYFGLAGALVLGMHATHVPHTF